MGAFPGGGFRFFPEPNVARRAQLFEVWIRPVVPEMNAFHQVLYVVQHTYVPEKKWGEVCKAGGDLQAKAEALATATLPKRVEAKAEAFKKESGQLVADAKALVAACQANQPAGIEKATATLHSRYEELGKIFE